MEYFFSTLWNKIQTDPVAAMLAGFIATSIIIGVIKRFMPKRG